MTDEKDQKGPGDHPDKRHSSEANARTQEFLEEAYRYGESYQAPALSDKGKITGSYVRNGKPSDFDNQVLVREVTPSVHQSTFQCSVSGMFIDKTVFSDENILLEILQNAEPKDSKGTWFDIEFFAKGQWRSAVSQIKDFKDKEIEAVRIIDNGRGYLPTDMTTVGGGKRDDAEAAGRFGTGMKTSDRSALGKEVRVLRYSRNWRAKPYLVPVLTSAGRDYTVSYNVKFTEKCFPGSVVEYRNLTKDMLKALREIDDRYLPLDSTFKGRLLEENSHGLILSPKYKNGEIMVNGRAYELSMALGKPLLYSYDLQDCVIDDQNRHYVDTSRAIDNIRQILQKTNNPNLFKKLFETANDAAYFEHHMGRLMSPPRAFLTAAKEFYGIDDFSKVYIKSDDTTQRDEKVLKRRGIKKIDCGKSKFLINTFKMSGIDSGKDLLEKITERRNEGRDAIGKFEDETLASCACRAISLLDGLLMDKDAEDKAAKRILVLLVEKDTEKTIAITYKEYLRRLKEKSLKKYYPKRFIVRLEGKSFDFGGNWNRKIEDFFAACVSGGIESIVYNGHQEFDPLKDEDGNLWVETRTWGNFPSNDFEINLEMTNQKQASDLGKMHEHSLELDPDYIPLASTQWGDIVSAEGGKIYERGIFVKKDKEAVLSYNIPVDVTRHNDFWGRMPKILEEVESQAAAEAVLKAAKDSNKNFEYYEYGICPTKGSVQQIWRVAFEKIFGSDVALDDLREELGEENPVFGIQESSKIKTVRVHPKLMRALCQCKVKRLSDAVQADKVLELNPTPSQDALLKISEIIDAAIKKSLPQGANFIDSEIKIAQELKNIFGQNLDFKQGYLNYILASTRNNNKQAIYLPENIVHHKRINQLVNIILRKKIEVYRNKFEDDNTYSEFQTGVLAAAGNALMDLDFFMKIKKMIMNKDKKIIELIERTVARVALPVPDSDGSHDAMKRKIRRETETYWKIFGNLLRLKNTSPTETIVFIALYISLIAGGVLGLNELKESGILGRIAGEINQVLPKTNSRPKSIGFEKLEYEEDSQVGVSIERSINPRGRFNSGNAYMEHLNDTFYSVPDLDWGHFMNEQSMVQYTGKGWRADKNEPGLPNQNYKKTQRYAHQQFVDPKNNKIYLRTMAGGYIDEKSITFIVKGKNIKEVKADAEKMSNGDYVLTLKTPGVTAVRYHTLTPVNWYDDAEKLKDRDFRRLPKTAYEYYTSVPGVNPSKIKFHTNLFPQVKNLQEFLNNIRNYPPYVRIKIIRSIIREMRYTRTERTEKAFSRFHRNILPEKDFLEFVFNAPELEFPGDGDCDVQNTIFALIARLSGIPTKLNYVITERGAGHGPASVYLPGIGWVLTDTMGKRSIQEGVSYPDDEHYSYEYDPGSPAGINATMRRKIQQRAKLRECLNVSE